MTPEQLILRRYEVIAGWPDMEKEAEIKVGDILQNTEAITYKFAELDKFPHLFKPLAWYEKREKDEMPYYVSSIGKNFYGIVFMVSNKTGEFVLKVGEDCTTAHLSNYLPATQSEYEQYIKLKQ